MPNLESPATSALNAHLCYIYDTHPSRETIWKYGLTRFPVDAGLFSEKEVPDACLLANYPGAKVCRLLGYLSLPIILLTTSHLNQPYLNLQQSEYYYLSRGILMAVCAYEDRTCELQVSRVLVHVGSRAVTIIQGRSAERVFTICIDRERRG